MSDTDAFATLSSLRFPLPCRLVYTACCPDKDLVALVSRLGGKDRLSLWKLQGSKKWEVDVAPPDALSDAIVDLVWSPNGLCSCTLLIKTILTRNSGQSIAVVHDPPLITIHSMQDGSEERILALETRSREVRASRVWWFPSKRSDKINPSAPDIFKRNGLIVCYFSLSTPTILTMALRPVGRCICFDLCLCLIG